MSAAMLPISLAPLFGLLAATTWGASDFAGGLSAKRTSVWLVVLYSQVFGLAFLAGLALVWGESGLAPADILQAALAGAIGEFGLILLYQGLAVGRMGVVAPLSAVLSALLPVGVGILTEGLPAPLQIAGIGLAIPAVWMVSAGGEHGEAKVNELLYGLASGVAFGFYFIMIDRLSSRAVFWPLATARLTSLIILIILAFILKPAPRPTLPRFPLIAAAGVLDSLGNLFFAMSTRAGRLDIAAVLASLYPAGTVLLAYVLLKERLNRSQWFGVALAMTAIVLISY
jgi:drug/metabolite transporter (DMT)-like permease